MGAEQKHKRQKGRLRPWLKRTLLGTGLLVGVCFSCTQTEKQTPLKTATLPAPTPPPRVQSAEVERAPAPELKNYAEAIRARNFERAAWLIDGSSEAEQKTPEVRYARARVALELGDIETALRQIDGLGKEFPLFAKEVDEVRREAARLSHDVSLMAALVPNQGPDKKLLIAEAHEKNASHSEARKLADEVIAHVESSKKKNDQLLSARAHALRARTLEAEGKAKEAAAELKWLAIHAPTVAPQDVGLDQTAHEKMKRLDEATSLSKEQRLERARTFSERGWIEETERELNALSDRGPPPSEANGLLAWAYYAARSDYERAAELFLKASKSEPNKRIEYLYYEAKALARSHRDREAIEKYDQVARLGGRFADHASYQAARLRMIDGQFKDAAQSFGRYLKKYKGSAKHRSDAEYSRAISHLASKQYDQAASELRTLIEKASGERTRVRLLELLGVTLLGATKKQLAIDTFRQVIESRPLSLPALLATARLRELGEPHPPLIPPAPASIQHESIRSPLKLEVPEKAWRLSRVGLDEEAEVALKEKESSLRGPFADRWGEAMCETYGLLNSAKRRYQIAQSAVRWHELMFAPAKSTRWEWNCAYPSPYKDIVDTQAVLRRVPASFIYGIMRQESAFRPSVVSPARAVGLMQIIPPTAERIAEELASPDGPDLMNAPATNIRFGAYYLRRLLDMFGDRKELAAASYNAGPHAVTRWLRAGENLPLDIFVATIPYRETRNYVYLVMGNYARYAYLSDQEEVPKLDLEIPKGLKATNDAY